VEHLAALTTHIRRELSKVVIGQQDLVDQMILVLVCGGHAVMEGVPGLAKTLAVKSMARICGLGFQRVQCTADLMPSDVTGTNVFDLSKNVFTLRRGPVFTDLLLVDEINRTSPRTQAALLEAMEERQVTIDGTRYPLPDNFTVFATQNPIEFEGTYPLPEAQLDRFLLKIVVPYPSAEDENQILSRYEAGFDPRHLEDVHLEPFPLTLLTSARQEVAAVRVEPSLRAYVVSLARRTRDWPAISLGASPRAVVGMFFVARAIAAMQGRDFLLPDDVKAAALPVLRHRILLKPEADLEGLTSDQVIKQVIGAVEIPK
jgi:MoxR-like ATPase